MTFHVGQKVVCVDDEWIPGNPTFIGLVKGAVYTIQRIGDISLFYREPKNECALWLDSAIALWNEEYWPIGSRRFRPVEPKCAQLFRDIAAGVSNGSPIIDDPQPQQVPLSPETIRELIGGGGHRL